MSLHISYFMTWIDKSNSKRDMADSSFYTKDSENDTIIDDEEALA